MRRITHLHGSAHFTILLSKQKAIKKNNTPSISKVKQKQKWYWKTKNVYLKRSIFTWDSAISIFMQK